MSVFSLETRAGNPVTVKDVDDICAGLGVTIKDEEKEEYKTLLAVFHESMESLMDLPGEQQLHLWYVVTLLTCVDFYPPVDLERFPRRSIHFPKAEENSLNAWAWKCEVKDTQARPGGSLDGRSVALKDCVALAGVPFLLGTNMIQDYVPVCGMALLRRSRY